MSGTPTPVVAYIRVSTTDQTVKRQEGDLADDCMTHNLSLVNTFTDKTSASLYADRDP